MFDHSEIKYIGDLQRLQVKPGDLFVLSTDRSLPLETAKHIQKQLSDQLGGAPVIILSDGLKLGVMGEAEA